MTFDTLRDVATDLRSRRTRRRRRRTGEWLAGDMAPLSLPSWSWPC